jgi:hypothetical protein
MVRTLKNPTSADIAAWHAWRIVNNLTIEIPPQYQYSQGNTTMAGFISYRVELLRKKMAEENKKRKIKEAAKSAV